LFDFEAFVYESIVHLLLPPTCIAHTIAIRLHVYCAIYDAPPPDPPFVCHTIYNIPLLYAIHYTILIMAISCQ